MNSSQPKSMWMTKLNTRAQELINHLGIPADMGERIKAFMFNVAREQYKAGNASGIRWARTNPPKGSHT